MKTIALDNTALKNIFIAHVLICTLRIKIFFALYCHRSLRFHAISFIRELDEKDSDNFLLFNE